MHETVDADVVACFEYRYYQQNRSYLEGSSFLTDKDVTPSALLHLVCSVAPGELAQFLKMFPNPGERPKLLRQIPILR